MLDTAIQFTALFGVVYLAVCFVSHSLKWSDRYAPQAATVSVQDQEAPVQEESLSVSTELPADADGLIPTWTEINADIERHWPASQIKEERDKNMVGAPTWNDADFDLSIESINAFERRFSAAASISVPSAMLRVEEMPMVERAAGDMTKAELKAELRRLGRQLPRGRASHAKLVGLVEASWAAESDA